MTFNFEIDIFWCLEQLQKDGRINERDKLLVQTTHRQKEQLKWHPLQWIANFNLKDQLNAGQTLTLNRLCLWLAEKSQVPLFVIDPLKADVAVLTGVMSQEFAVRNHILAVEVHADRILIGTDQPFSLEWKNNLERSLSPKKVEPVLLNPEQLRRYLVEYYQVSRAVNSSQNSSPFDRDNKGVEALLQLGDTQNPDANDQHIVKLVDWVLQFAFEQGASDIHLEPRKEKGKVRFRIDGVLHTIYNMPANTLTAVISRIKILGRMNVAEKRKPQDGRLKTRTPKGQETELRLSTLPTAFGEKLVMRIFDPEVLVRSFQQLGFEGHLLHSWQQLTQHSHGIILVTGPTGSGKTTTLYSSLKQLATEQVNVCTIEDPIEMLEPSFNQMQVNPTIELGFADGVRALMRQDPDIIMVGEIRDHDTANMAIQAALTGHLVLSTLHTNDAPSSLTRLHDLGVQPFLTAATILGVLAQRLVRRLCPQCKQETSMNEQEWEHLTFDYIMEMPETMYKAVGCETCRHTGYKGRVGIYEFMPVSLELKSLISAHGTLNDLKVQAKKEGVEPLRIAGARKVIEGVTTLEEVLRVVPLS
ncbi:type II/IV secretion system protein [Acinetobacter junii]|jgi:general secretion pathway protein E|uniref:GspE/PulE family protein n=6 Tax=Gammaproteobacteria TaxID=1236 RepID=A0AAW5RAW9_ACIJU|nr:MULTISPECIES: GspE/PulE family protein [Acinetobacter]MBQ1494994.1 type II/IV secretion system protein [Acinetobacter sp.]APU48961.1 type II secretion system protein E [Acinetobacter junii]ATU45248.1 type II/IV secretion system protein [Acinetobacter junii]AWA47755.1 type II/IV secretion system protein [Acinetobacter junii]EEY93526.1 putative general secretion pathway protein E [Acinetobacter junii SH205]